MWVYMEKFMSITHENDFVLHKAIVIGLSIIITASWEWKHPPSNFSRLHVYDQELMSTHSNVKNLSQIPAEILAQSLVAQSVSYWIRDWEVMSSNPTSGTGDFHGRPLPRVSWQARWEGQSVLTTFHPRTDAPMGGCQIYDPSNRGGLDCRAHRCLCIGLAWVTPR